MILEKKEDALQSDCYIWFHNSYPDLRGLLCYNLNNSANKIQGNKNKAMGVQSGRSDMVFYYKSNSYMIEFKDEKGFLSKSQKDWGTLIQNNGFSYFVIRDFQDFKNLIVQIIT